MSDDDGLARDYADAGFGGSLPWGQKPALLLIDFARCYFDAASSLRAPVEAARANAAMLVKAARDHRLPIVFTRVEYPLDREAEPARLFRKKIAGLAAWEVGNPMGEFTSELMPEAGDLIITKQFASGFFGTDLADQLHARNVDTVLVSGLTTSGCVRATATDALGHGFAPLVICDACGDRDPKIHQSNLFDLDAKYADVITTASALTYISSLADSF